MFYKNSLPLVTGDQLHPTSIGRPALNSKKSMSKRNSWPPTIPDTLRLDCEDPTPNMVVDLDIENVQVFLYPTLLDVMNQITASPRSSGLKDGRQIPNRSSRSQVPNVRMPPSDLWDFTPSKVAQGLITSTSSSEIGTMASSSSSWTRQSRPHHRPTSEREPLRTMAQAPIGSERYRWSSAPGAGSSSTPVFPMVPLPPGTCAIPVKKSPEPAPMAFVDVLSENKRRNPHAPAMVSMFNPLREKVPFRAWACMPLPFPSQHVREGNGTLTLPSARFRTSLYAIPVRARKECEWVSSCLSKGKQHWLNKIRNHCRDCRQETLRKKLLVFSYLNRQALFLHGPPISRVENGGDQMEVDDHNAESYDEDLLDSPTLRDFDDFNDFEEGSSDDDALLCDDVVDMRGRSLF